MDQPSVDFSDILLPLQLADGRLYHYYSLHAFEKKTQLAISRLPVSLRIILESLLRKCDGQNIKTDHALALSSWTPADPLNQEIPFCIARVLLQDFTGVPLLVDLATMRDAAEQLGLDPQVVEPLVPVDLVVDHSIQVDAAGSRQAFAINLEKEFHRNHERYEFLKWGQSAFKTFQVVPPSVGIVHQVNLEYLAQIVFEQPLNDKIIAFPDTLVGTDSHTTMVNGLGVVGWGVGGIEAEVGMLGEPIYLQTPAVVGVHLKGHLNPGVTATDLALYLTQVLRQAHVVGQFVEFYGEAAAHLSVADRATISNMAPEYGATMGYFPVDEKTLDYLRLTGRSESKIRLIQAYLKAQGLFGMPRAGQIDYTRTLSVDLSQIKPCVAGPKRPQDRIDLPDVKKRFQELLVAPLAENGYAQTPASCTQETALPLGEPFNGACIRHGSVLIAAITSCTNTSNPHVMIAAGLLAKKAVEKGLYVPTFVKASLAPGSRVVTDYLNQAGLSAYLDQLGFQTVGYGCTTCIGNSGPLDPLIEEALKQNHLIGVSVLSGNRNFEARVHPSIKANFLMSPPLVVAFALAGRIDIDFEHDPLGHNATGQPIYLKDIWPAQDDIEQTLSDCLKPEQFIQKYAAVYQGSPDWEHIKIDARPQFMWKDDSTYIQKPPFLDDFTLQLPAPKALKDMRALAILGDSVTTDHISPAGGIAPQSPAGTYLKSKGVDVKDFNSYGARRGNDRVMTRGTFANIRIKNQMAQGCEGGYTTHQPSGVCLTIFEASERYRAEHVPLILFAGQDYGMGSSRDWAAKGTALLGVDAVVAVSFERIHRSNLIGMGVLPLQLMGGLQLADLSLRGDERFSIEGFLGQPQETVTLQIIDALGQIRSYPLESRLDNWMEVTYYRHGGLLSYTLRNLKQKLAH